MTGGPWRSEGVIAYSRREQSELSVRTRRSRKTSDPPGGNVDAIRRADRVCWQSQTVEILSPRVDDASNRARTAEHEFVLLSENEEKRRVGHNTRRHAARLVYISLRTSRMQCRQHGAISNALRWRRAVRILDRRRRRQRRWRQRRRRRLRTGWDTISSRLSVHNRRPHGWCYCSISVPHLKSFRLSCWTLGSLRVRRSATRVRQLGSISVQPRRDN